MMGDSDTPRTDEAVRLCSSLTEMAKYMRVLEQDMNRFFWAFGEFATAKAEIESLKAQVWRLRVLLYAAHGGNCGCIDCMIVKETSEGKCTV